MCYINYSIIFKPNNAVMFMLHEKNLENDTYCSSYHYLFQDSLKGRFTSICFLDFLLQIDSYLCKK